VELIPTELSGVLIIKPRVFADERGQFLETWNRAAFARHGIDADFVQDNHSCSARGVLRGLHYQLPRQQGKLIRVTAGRAFDVAVDIRAGSPSYGRWFGMELSASDKCMLWIPPGFAHGFLSLEDGTELLYKCTEFYDPDGERSLMWDDPAIGIEWPLDGLQPNLSAKDRAGERLRAARAMA
jgi:dTDP-4-dehydrorhamnose 3,5-epimerase